MTRQFTTAPTLIQAFNLVNLLAKLVGSLAAFAAAIAHAFGLRFVDPALDILVGAIVVGAVQAVIWVVVRLGFGVDIAPSSLQRRL